MSQTGAHSVQWSCLSMTLPPLSLYSVNSFVSEFCLCGCLSLGRTLTFTQTESSDRHTDRQTDKEQNDKQLESLTE